MENKKSLVALALVALVGVVGATFAYFTSTAKLTNEFTTGTYSTSVKEEFVSPDNWIPGTTTTKKVNVTNNGSVDVAVRAKYTEKWTAKDGTVLSGTRNGEKVAQFNIGSDWEKATDGYYYYEGTLTNGQTSSDFISSVTFNPNFELEEGIDIECTTTKENGKTTVSCDNLTSGYAGAIYSLDITIETIQADQRWTYIAAPSYNTPPTADNLFGVWLFNENVIIKSAPSLDGDTEAIPMLGTQNVNFTSNNQNFTKISNVCEENCFVPDIGNYPLYYDNFYYYSTDYGWESEEYRTINFGLEGQEVDESFFLWLNANAVYQGID